MEKEIISSIDKDKLLEELVCPICLSIFDDPILDYRINIFFVKNVLTKYKKLIKQKQILFVQYANQK